VRGTRAHTSVKEVRTGTANTEGRCPIPCCGRAWDQARGILVQSTRWGEGGVWPEARCTVGESTVPYWEYARATGPGD
jgi:hypothetical protein